MSDLAALLKVPGAAIEADDDFDAVIQRVAAVPGLR